MNRTRDAGGFGVRQYGGAFRSPKTESGAEPPHSKTLREGASTGLVLGSQSEFRFNASRKLSMGFAGVQGNLLG